MPAKPKALKEKHAAAREQFVADLGLEYMGLVSANAAIQFHKYNWPARANGTKYDRFVYILVYHDGSWTELIATNALGIEETKAQMRIMVAASI